MVKVNLTYVAVIVGALALYGTSRQLLLNADDADLRYQKHSVSEGVVHGPELGAAYAYNHLARDFKPTKICKLMIGGGSADLSLVSIRGRNWWGEGWNGAMDSVTEYVGDKIRNTMRAAEASREWQFNKRFWVADNQITFDSDCLAKVEEFARDPDHSVFIVETLYFDKDAVENLELVQLSHTSIVFDDDSADRISPIKVKSVLNASWLTRSKDKWGIVRIE